MQEFWGCPDPCHDDDFDERILAFETRDQFESIGLRHEDICQNDIDRLLAIEVKPFLSVRGSDGTMTGLFENLAEQIPYGLLVVNDQD